MIKLKFLLNEAISYKIYCDMDGVLTDFDKEFMKLSGSIKLPKFEDKYGSKKFWKLIDDVGIKFWAQMSWMPDGKKLWNYIKNKNVEILSSPSRSPDSSKGKKIWVSKELGGLKLNLIAAKNKQKFAEANAILIDDMKKNIDAWNAAGGIGILHKSASDTISKLKKYD